MREFLIMKGEEVGISLEREYDEAMQQCDFELSALGINKNLHLIN